MQLIFKNNTEVVKYLEDNAEKVKKSRFSTREADDFTNYKTYDQAFEGLKYGNTQYNNVFLDSLKDATDGEDGQAYTPDVTGLYYDMGAVTEGIPENAFNVTDNGEGKKTLKIYIDIAFVWSIPNKHLLNRGVAIFNLLNTLTLKGYILDVNFICDTYNNCTHKYYNFTFKLPENEVNIPTIAFYTSPEFFRVINFVLLDINESDPSDSRGKRNKKYTDGLFISGGYRADGEPDREIEQAITTPEKAKNHIIKLFNDFISKQ